MAGGKRSRADRGAARPRSGPARRRHGAVRAPLRRVAGTADRDRPRRDRLGQHRDRDPRGVVDQGRPRASTCRRSRPRRAGSRASSGPALAESYLPLVLGGDQSISLGTLGGMSRDRGVGGLLWLDAHADLNTPDTSPTGNVHGMTLAAALGHWWGRLRERGVDVPGARSESGRADRDTVARPTRETEAARARGPRLHDERHRPDRDRARGPRVPDARRGRRLRPRFARPRRTRPGGGARRRHAGQGRPLLPRGAPRARARRRVGLDGLDGGRRGQPDARRRATRPPKSRSS